MCHSLDSPYRTAINEVLLKLKESNEVETLIDRWWKDESQRIDPDYCPREKTEEEEADSDKLGLANVGGVFVVLFVGLFLSIFIGVMEFLWNVKKVSIDEKVIQNSSYKIKASTKAGDDHHFNPIEFLFILDNTI